MTVACVICGAVEAEPLYPGFIRCRGCGHVTCNARLARGRQPETYGSGYFCGGEYSDYLADRRLTQDNFRLRLRVLRRFLDPARHRSLLEIGCAYGFFLDVARWDFKTLAGIDVAEEGVRYARGKLGLDATAGDFLKCDFGARTFDVICMWDTIEHLEDPRAFVERIARLTGPGALVAVTTGDIGSLNARLKKGRWRLLQAPTHLHFFSRSTLGKLLGRNGFDVVYSGHCGFYRSVGMALHRLSLAGSRGRLVYDFCHRVGLDRLRFYLNLYDIMYIIARKQSA